MRKIYLLAAAVFLLCLTVSAQKRSRSQMIQAASEILSQHPLITSSADQSTEIKILDESKEQLSIVGYDNGPFVIIANDESFPAVLGYSNSNAKFSMENAAPAFNWYLNMANRNLQDCIAKGQSLPATNINPAYKQEVPPLCTTKWGQDDPYNRQTPTYSGNHHYVTGCVATAMAQAMNYYKYPTTGRGKISYYFNDEEGKQKVRVGFADEEILWKYMLDVYENPKFTSDNAYAVSYLMKIVGASVQMQYGPGGSGAYTYLVAPALHNYFKYDESTECFAKDLMHEDEWNELIFKSLNEGRPIVFGASSSIGGQDAGHSFVVDGYDKKGKVHVNFGWNGSEDGNYELLNMHGYDHGFDATPLRMPTEGCNITSFFALWGKSISYSRNAGTISATIMNGHSRIFSGMVGAVLKNLADGSEQVLGYEVLSDAEYSVDMDIKVGASLPANLPDGDYRLYLATKGRWEVKDDPTDRHEQPKIFEEPTWQPVHAKENFSNSVLVKVSNGSITTKVDGNSSWVLGIDNVVCTNKTSDIVRVYDIQGRMVYTSSAKDFRIADIPADGMLIIKNGSEVRKFIK